MNHSQEDKLSIPLSHIESYSIVVPQFISHESDQSALVNKSLSNLLKQELNCLLLNLGKILEVEKTNKTIEKIIAINKPRLISINTLIEHLCNGIQEQPFKLIFHNDTPYPGYKGKNFTLRGNIVDKNNKIVFLDEPMQFRAVIFNAEHPIKIINSTRYNEKIIDGNTVIETLSAIYFRRLMIKEVSSYHPSKMFNLVILADDVNEVKPFVFTKFVVKSNKLKPYEIRKKIKVDEFYNFLGNL